MSKVNYVCATCGQDFTRRYSASRHNNHFHFGNGIIVRLLEYIIGRTNGRFPPPLPANNNNLSTRIIRKWWYNNDHDSSSPFNGNNNGLRGRNNGRFTTIPDQLGNAFDCGTVGRPVKSNNNVSKDISKIAPPPYNISPPLPSPSSLSDKPDHTKQSDILEEFQQRISRLAEIKILLTPYLSYQDICYILQVLNIQCIISGNNNFLDQMLILVRQNVKFRQDLDQLSSPDPPLYMNNNNNLAATPRENSLIGNNRFIAQSSFQMYPLHSHLPPPPPPPPPLQQQSLEQQGQNFHPIFFYTLLRPPRSLDEISNIMRNISAKL
jgi:hypothetical protein